VVFHVGSHKGAGWKAVREQVFRSIAEILERSAGETPGVSSPTPGVKEAGSPRYLVLENSAGAGGIIGAKFSELGEIIKAVKDSRLKVCLDTAHAFESGYAINKEEGLKKALDKFEAEIGLERLVAIHANDSKTPFASGVDRHENIGQGYIGEEGFRLITHDPRLASLPFIIETPGFDNRGADRKNLEVLRQLAKD